MKPEPRKYLHDIVEAAALAREFIEGKTLADYPGDSMLRASVERNLAIVGEAVAQLLQVDKSAAARPTSHRRIGFRNILVHPYAEADHRLVWDVVGAYLPTLLWEMASILEESHDG